MESTMPVETYVNTTASEAPVAVEGVAPVELPSGLPIITAHGAFQQSLKEQAAAAGAAQPSPEVGGASQEMAAADDSGYVGRQRYPTSSYKSRSGPSFCQVQGCGVSLEGHKDYHQRYKVCEHHLKVDFIEREGQRVRFCQQCGRFQPLDEFDDNKRSCRARLERHNARRRKRPREDGMGGPGGSGGRSSMGGGVRRAPESRGGLLGLSSMPLQPRDLQAMQEALHFASTTLMHASQAGAAGKQLAIPPLPGMEGSHLAQLHSLSSQLVGKEGAEGGGAEEGGDGAGAGLQHPLPLPGTMGTMPFVPAPEILLLLLRAYANMFHYDLDDAQVRPRLPPSNLPPAPPLPPMDAVQLAVDPAQMQQVLHMQALQQAQQQAAAQQAQHAAGMAGLQSDGGGGAGAGGGGEDVAATAAQQQQYAASAEHAQQQYEQYAAAMAAAQAVAGHEVHQQYVAAVQQAQQEAAGAAEAGGMAAAAPAGDSGEGAGGEPVTLTPEQVQAAAMAALASGAASLPLMVAAGMPHLAAAAAGQPDPSGGAGGGDAAAGGGADVPVTSGQLSEHALLMHQYALLQSQALQLAQLDHSQHPGGLEGVVAPEVAAAAVQHIMAQHSQAAAAAAQAAAAAGVGGAEGYGGGPAGQNGAVPMQQ